jgi:hypothetical protein
MKTYKTLHEAIEASKKEIEELLKKQKRNQREDKESEERNDAQMSTLHVRFVNARKKKEWDIN